MSQLTTHHHGRPPPIRIYESGAARHVAYPLSPSSLPASGPLPSRHHRSTTFPAAPMPIPHAREAPPPPLPPPRYISGLNTDHYGADPEAYSPHTPWLPGSTSHGVGAASPSGQRRTGVSLLGAMRAREEGLGITQPDNSVVDPGSKKRLSFPSSAAHSVDTDMPDAPDANDDEPRSTSRRASSQSYRLHSESQLGQRSLENSSNAYDKQLLARMSGTKTSAPSNQQPSPRPSHTLSPITQDSSSAITATRHNLTGHLKPLAVPDRLHSGADAHLSRWSSAPSSGVSPGNTTFRSPFETTSSSSSNTEPTAWRQNISRSHSEIRDEHRPRDTGEEQSIFSDNDFSMEEDAAARAGRARERGSLGSEDAFGSAGISRKRQAQSPPPELRASAGHELQRQRSAQMLSNRSVTTAPSRYAIAAGSVSSASSLGHKTGSYASTVSRNYSLASSITSYGENASPNTLSPAANEMDYLPVSPYAASRSPNPSPQNPLATKGPSQPHQRILTEHEPLQIRKMSSDSTATTPQSRQSSVAHRPGLLICECCPKKPKKFESLADLRAHEQEKQYQCQYCPNRFKNKNEAERHQNSLHLRRHSWSCAALVGVHAAFHPGSSQPTHLSHQGQPDGSAALFDICGYCGEEFTNDPPDWDVRADHLNTVHKYGECNQQKKFFRADHFRQHLKHSHAGSPGKWTNILENACMKDEPPPQVLAAAGPAGQRERLGAGDVMASPTMTARTSVDMLVRGNTAGASQNPIRGAIDEVKEEG